MLNLERRNARSHAITVSLANRSLARPPRRWWRQTGVVLFASLTLARTPAGAQVKWNGIDGDWDVAANWSSNPALPGAGDEVVNDTAGTITHGMAIDDIINSFLNSSSGGFIMNAGSLTINTTYQNTGSGSLTVNGGTLNVSGDMTLSGGGATILNGGAVNLNSNYSSNGDFTLAGGNMSGVYTGGAPVSTFQAGGNVVLSSGVLSNFAIDASQSASFTLNGGTIQNSDVQNSNLIQFVDNANLVTSTFDNVTLHGGLNVTGQNNDVHLINNTSFSPGDSITIGTTYDGNSSWEGHRLLSIDTGMTLNNNTITFGNNQYSTSNQWSTNYLIIDGGNTLTVDSASLIHGAGGIIQGSYFTGGSSTLDNFGAISFDAPVWGGGGNSIIGGNGLDTVINESSGLIEVNSNATNNPYYFDQQLTIQSASFTNYGLTQANSSISVNTVLNINVADLWNYGTIQAISTGGGATSVYINPANYDNLGTVIADGVGSTVYLQGGSGYFGYAFTTAQASGLLARNGGAIVLNTTMDNSGTSFDVSSVIDPSGGTFMINNGRILNGDVYNSQLLRFGTGYDILDGTALHSGDMVNHVILDLSQPGSYAWLRNGATLDPGTTILIGSNYPGNYNYDNPSLLSLDQNTTLNGHTITFGNSYYANTLVIDGSYTLTIDHASVINGASGNIQGSYYDTGSSTLDNHGTISFNMPNFSGANSTIGGNGLDTVINESDGLIEVNNSTTNNPYGFDQTLYLQSATLTNNAGGMIQAINNNSGAANLIVSPVDLYNYGTIQAVSTGSGAANLYLAPTNYDNLGTIIANGATANVILQGGGGNVSGAGLTTAQITGVSLLNGAHVYLSTTLDNTGANFDPTSTVAGSASDGSSFIMSGGRILNGTVTNSNLLVLDTNLNIFDGVALDGSLNLNNNGRVLLLNGASFNNANPGAPLVFNLGNTTSNNYNTGGSMLDFDESYTLSNTTITFGNSYYGGYKYNNWSNTLVIDGGNTLTIGHDSLIHGAAGIIQGGYYYGGSNTLDNHGAISFDSPAWSGGYYGSSSIDSSLSTVINESDGLIEVNNSVANNPNNWNQTLTIAPITLNNLGTIQAVNTSGGNTYLYINPTTYTSLGMAIANGANSYVYLQGGGGYVSGAGFPGASSSLSAINGGTITLQTTLDNTGATFDPSVVTGTGPTAGNFLLDNGRILNGAVTNSMLLRFSENDNILDGVALDGSLDLSNGGHVRLLDGTSFNNANPGAPVILNLGSTASNNYSQVGAALGFGDTRTLSNTTITFGNSYYGGYQYNNWSNALTIDGGQTLTIAHNSLIHGASGIIDGTGGAGATLDNHGVISFDSPTWDNGYSSNIGGNGLDTVINESDGLIEVNNSAANNPNNWNQTLTIAPITLNNLGTIQAVNTTTGNAYLYLAPTTYTNVGTVIANGTNSNVIFQGGGGYIGGAGFTSAQLSGVSAVNGGTVTISTTLNNTGATFDPTLVPGNLIFSSSSGSGGSRILGGSIINTDQLRFGAGDNQLDGIQSFDAGLNLSNGGFAHLLGTTDLAAFPTNATFTIDNGGALALEGFGNTNARTLDNATIAFGDTGANRLTIEGTATLTLGSNLTLTGKYGTIGGVEEGWGGPSQIYNDGANTVINNTTISSQTAGGSWTVDPYYLTNNATMQAKYGASLAIAGSTWNGGSTFLNSGNVIADGTDGMGNASTVNVTNYALTNNGTMEAINGGTLSLNLGSYATVGTVIANGTNSNVIFQGAGGYIGGAGIPPAQLSGVSAINGGTVTISTTLNNTGATFDPTLITGTGPTAGNLIFSSSSGSGGSRILGGSIINADQLRFGPGDNQLDGIQSFDAGLNLSNGGFAHLLGTTDLAAFPTNATFTIDNGGALALEGFGNTNARTLDNATIAFGDTGTNRLTIEGTATLTLGSNLTLTGKYGVIGGSEGGWGGPGQVYNSGANTVINNTTISSQTAGGSWTVDPYYLTNNATMQAKYGASLAIAGSTWNSGNTFLNSGNVIADGTDGAATSSTVSIDYYNLTNNGTMEAINGGTLAFSPYTYARVGSIVANGAGSQVYLYAPVSGVTTLTGSDNISATNGGTVYLETTLNNAGHTLDVGANGSFLLTSGYISGGSIVHSNNVGAGNYANNVLDGVTLDGGVSANGGLLHVYSNTTFGANPAFTIDNSGLLSVEGDRTLTGANITFGSNASSSNNRLAIEGNSTWTLDATSTVTAGYGTLGYQYFEGGSNSLINNGSITDNLNGGNLTIATRYFTNNGTLEALNGSQITISNTYFGAMTNTGSMIVGSGSTVNVYPYGVSQTGATASTQVDGSLQLYGYALALNGGTLKGGGAIQGDVVNAATVAPGDSPGKLTIQGNYTQTSAGVLAIELGGTQQGVSYDLLSVLNNATLAGTLDVKLINGFTPTVGETFDFLTYGSRTGTFDTILPFDNGYDYTVNYNDMTGMAKLVVSVAPAVPEMSTLGAMALMLGAGWLAIRHRRQQAA